MDFVIFPMLKDGAAEPRVSLRLPLQYQPLVRRRRRRDLRERGWVRGEFDDGWPSNNVRGAEVGG